MITQFVQQVLDDNPQLSSLPQTMVEVLRVARDENALTCDLAEILQEGVAPFARFAHAQLAPHVHAELAPDRLQRQPQLAEAASLSNADRIQVIGQVAFE